MLFIDFYVKSRLFVSLCLFCKLCFMCLHVYSNLVLIDIVQVLVVILMCALLCITDFKYLLIKCSKFIL